ncbi:hypothetical protein HYU14_03450 [Candidatus Woesearchaeota archaeon]|nr:hypothetical protein [Candidatus Woesearchaeota archaeon]
MFARLTGGIIILFGVFIGLFHFHYIKEAVFGVNIVMLGIALFIVHELHALVRNAFGEGNKLVSIGVPVFFILIAGSYFAIALLPKAIAENLLLIISVLMVAEGLYRVH